MITVPKGVHKNKAKGLKNKAGNTRKKEHVFRVHQASNIFVKGKK